LKIKFKSDLLFRKAFIPWYDTELSLILTLIFAVVVLLFSMTGVAAALDTPRFTDYTWFPGLLMALSLILTISSLIRLIRRWEL
jgi:hypothetical protein